jgi:phosphocarrier protein
MVQREMTVTNPAGFHARPAALLVAQAPKSKSIVTISFIGKTINAKSMLKVLGGGIRNGAQITVTADGEDEQETLEALCLLINNLPE